MINSDYIRMKDAPYYPFISSPVNNCKPLIVNWGNGNKFHSFSKVEIYTDSYYLVATSGTKIKVIRNYEKRLI